MGLWRMWLQQECGNNTDGHYEIVPLRAHPRAPPRSSRNEDGPRFKQAQQLTFNTSKTKGLGVLACSSMLQDGRCSSTRKHMVRRDHRTGLVWHVTELITYITCHRGRRPPATSTGLLGSSNSNGIPRSVTTAVQDHAHRSCE